MHRRSSLRICSVLSVFLGCGGESTGLTEDQGDEPNDSEPTPVEAVVTGPDTVEIPVDGSRTVTFSAEESTGPITRILWMTSRDSVPFAEGPSVELTFSESQELILRVRVVGDEGQMDEAFPVVKVLYDLDDGPPVLGFSSHTRDARGLAVGLMHPQTGDVRMIYLIEGAMRSGDWSPDFTRIVFSQHGPVGPNDIYVIDRDGSNLVQLFHHDGVAQDPVWSPDGEWIAYVDDIRNGPVSPPDELFLIRPDGSDRHPVSDSERSSYEFCCFHPAWDPSGRRIAIGGGPVDPTDRFAHPPRRIIIVTDPFGLKERRVIPTDAQIEEAFGKEMLTLGHAGLDWSPDGTWIAFAALARDESGYLARIRADGTGEIEILAEKRIDPNYSPSGEFIYFTELMPNGRSHVMRMPADGGAIEDLSARTSPAADDRTVFF